MVRHIADRVAVMYSGELVEVGPVESLFSRPRHPYTEALLAAVPVPASRRRDRPALLRGEVADSADPPPGCRLSPRCPYAEARCGEQSPGQQEISSGHTAAGHSADSLSLRGPSSS